MQEIVWCTLFVSRCLPCLVKVDKDAVKDMPDEETMMRTVSDEEAKVIALNQAQTVYGRLARFES